MARPLNEVLIDLQKREKDDREKAMNIFLEMVKNNLARLDKIKDPMTRHTLFLEKLLTIADISAGVTNTTAVNVSEELKTKIATVMTIFNRHVDSLLEWIQSPVYSPDHPVGNMMMKGCEKDFDDRK